ncbi:hypothetical protein B0H19DRAFT_1188252 [Mycena capillaripes]|nr:hypothetical protein B0H19DRAFT_1188252 [Mycena capillaripes]
MMRTLRTGQTLASVLLFFHYTSLIRGNAFAPHMYRRRRELTESGFCVRLTSFFKFLFDRLRPGSWNSAISNLLQTGSNLRRHSSLSLLYAFKPHCSNISLLLE